MSKKQRRTTEATKLMEQLTGTDQPVQGEETFEQIKENNLKALADLRQNALVQLHHSAQLGLCIKDPKIANSELAGRASQLVKTLTNDAVAMNSEMANIKAREEHLATVETVEEFIPLALELGEEHQLWQSKFETGVVPVLEEIETLIKSVVEPKEIAEDESKPV